MIWAVWVQVDADSRPFLDKAIASERGAEAYADYIRSRGCTATVVPYVPAHSDGRESDAEG